MILYILLASSAALAVILFVWCRQQMRAITWMPGQSYKGTVRGLTGAEAKLREDLELHVNMLAGEIGDRHVERPGSLEAAAEYIHGVFTAAGFEVKEHEYDIDNHTVKNLEVEIKGSTHPDEIIVVGAHYDTYLGSPGADDNATGIAAVLETAKLFRTRRPARTIRFVVYTQEERPNGKRGTMGSQVYSRACRQRNENIICAFALESMGYYSDEPKSQMYPPPLSWYYPTTGNFIGFIGDRESATLVRQCVASFRRHTQFPCEGIASPRWVPGVGSSDHEPFWQQGYRGIMVTCTAPFRNPHYHEVTDTPANVDFERFTIVTAGVARVIDELAQ